MIQRVEHVKEFVAMMGALALRPPGFVHMLEAIEVNRRDTRPLFRNPARRSRPYAVRELTPDRLIRGRAGSVKIFRMSWISLGLATGRNLPLVPSSSESSPFTTPINSGTAA